MKLPKNVNMEKYNYLLGYKNLRVYQDSEMFNFSIDSILLPNFVTLNKNIQKILDIGCGNLPISLILTTKTKAKITAVEIQKDVYDLALKNLKLNKLEEQIELINDDICNLYKEIPTETFDVIVCNPPFFKVNSTSHLNKNDYKTIARHEVTLNLDDLFKISKKLLKNNGIISIVHRPERLVDIIEAMHKYNITPKKIQLVYPKKDKDANILLIEGTKNGNAGIKFLAPLFVHNLDGSYTDEVKKYFE